MLYFQMMHFNSELKDLFARCKSVNTHEVGTEREKEQLRAGTEHMVSFCSEIKDTMQVRPHAQGCKISQFYLILILSSSTPLKV